MKIFDAAATQAPLRFDALVPALRAAFATRVQAPQRHVHEVEAGTDRGTVLIMPAWSEAGVLGIKTINIYPGNSARGLPGLHATYVLYYAHSGVPAAHAAVRTIEEVVVWNHRLAGAEALAAEWRAAGWKARAARDLEHAVRQADIVSCATLATSPLVRGVWLAPGSHLDLIGSFTPGMREADPACFAGARTFIDTDEALQKAGELLDAIAAGTLRPEAIQGTLEGLCSGARAGRSGHDERTVFKAVGSALEDLAAATMVWQSTS